MSRDLPVRAVIGVTLALAALLLVLLAPGPAGSAAPVPQVSLPEIESEVMCPICGTLLELSHAPAAERERVFIRRLIRQGKTKEEIKRALVAEYGGQVLAEPEREGINLWAYIVPTVLIGLAALLLGVSVLRSRRGGPPAGGDDLPDDDDSLDSDDRQRLERDMARFDL